MTNAAFSPYARTLTGLMMALALAAPLAAEVGGAKTDSLRDMAARVLTPGALVDPAKLVD